MKYPFIAENEHTYSVERMRQVLEVTRSGYYAWLNRKPSVRHQQRQALDQQVKGLFLKHKQRYGAERLQRKMPSRLAFLLILNLPHS